MFTTDPLLDDKFWMLALLQLEAILNCLAEKDIQDLKEGKTVEIFMEGK